MSGYSQLRAPWSIDLRRCQREAVAAWVQARPRDALIDLTPGAGKSLVIARIAYGILVAGAATRVFVVVPTNHLRVQLAATLRSIGVAVTDSFVNADGVLPPSCEGATLTYAQVAAAPAVYARLFRGAFVALDESHHVGANATWGEAIARACAEARYRLQTSGTAFRTDEAQLPFLEYVGGRAQALYRYGYEEGLQDGIVRPVVFEAFGAEVTWQGTDGKVRTSHTGSKIADEFLGQRTRAVLGSDEWLEAVVQRADDRLRALRQSEHPSAGALAAAIDMEHARKLAAIVERVSGTSPAVVLSDDPRSSARIASFRSGSAPWMVAVRQVCEGVDVPRIRGLVYATSTMSRMFFRQIVGRALRMESGIPGVQTAFVVMPEHPDLRSHAAEFSRAIELWGKHQPVALPSPPFESRASDAPGIVTFSTSSYGLGVIAQTGSAPIVGRFGSRAEVPSNLAAPVSSDVAALSGPDPLTRLRARREQVNRLVARLARETGTPHATIHRKLAKRCGATLHEASEAQIEARLREIERWLSIGRVV